MSIKKIVCKCCKKEYTEKEFKKLVYLGIGSGLEFRRCSCNNTLSMKYPDENRYDFANDIVDFMRTAK